MKNKTPEKPKKMREQVDQLWDAMYNHLPTRLHWQDIKINFILAILAILIAISAINLALIFGLQ